MDLSSGVVFESIDGVVLKNDISDYNLFQHDEEGNFVGLIQNPMQKDAAQLGTEKFSTGYLMDAPLFDKTYTRKVDDVIAWWYNDFGLECTRTKQTGWLGWYYWSWNNYDAINDQLDNAATYEYTGTVAEAYDPERHPLLGFYQGDDPKALDWITYWMLDYGVNVGGLLSIVNPYNDPTYDFEDPGHRDHWMYQWLKNTKNSQKMRYLIAPEVYWGGINDTQRQNLKSYIKALITKTYGTYKDNAYTITKNGKQYPVIFFKQEGALRDNLDGNMTANIDATLQFYRELADFCQELGYGGVAIMASLDTETPLTRYFDSNPTALEEDDVLRYYGRYGSTNTIETPTIIQDYIDNFSTDSVKRNTVAGITISRNTHSPHGSNFETTGHSPEVLGAYLDTVLTGIGRNSNFCQNAISIHNVSEWAECGPGLIPNMKNGFAYLKEIKARVIVE